MKYVRLDPVPPASLLPPNGIVFARERISLGILRFQLQTGHEHLASVTLEKAGQHLENVYK
jgi:hypothetical protein